MKNLFNNFEKTKLDEIIFENRNKEYGAYALRQEYDRILSKSLFVGAAVFGALAITPFILSYFSKVDIIAPEMIAPKIILKDVTEVILPPKEIQKTIAPFIKTVTSPDYKPVRDIVKDQPIPTIKDREDAAIGPVTQDGPTTNVHYVPAVSDVPSIPTVSVPTNPVEAPLDPNAIVKDVDVAASFSGGINLFRDRVAQNIDAASFTESGVISAIVTFIVEKDGSISHIKANGVDKDFNKEAERAVRSVKSKWIAAKYKNQAVRSYFKIPISMRVE